MKPGKRGNKEAKKSKKVTTELRPEVTVGIPPTPGKVASAVPAKPQRR